MRACEEEGKPERACDGGIGGGAWVGPSSSSCTSHCVVLVTLKGGRPTVKCPV